MEVSCLLPVARAGRDLFSRLRLAAALAGEGAPTLVFPAELAGTASLPEVCWIGPATTAPYPFRVHLDGDDLPLVDPVGAAHAAAGADAAVAWSGAHQRALGDVGLETAGPIGPPRLDVPALGPPAGADVLFLFDADMDAPPSGTPLHLWERQRVGAYDLLEAAGVAALGASAVTRVVLRADAAATRALLWAFAPGLDGVVGPGLGTDHAAARTASVVVTDRRARAQEANAWGRPAVLLSRDDDVSVDDEHPGIVRCADVRALPDALRTAQRAAPHVARPALTAELARAICARGLPRGAWSPARIAAAAAADALGLGRRAAHRPRDSWAVARAARPRDAWAKTAREIDGATFTVLGPRLLLASRGAS